MKKSELRQIIKEEIKKTLYTERHIKSGKNKEVKERDWIWTDQKITYRWIFIYNFNFDKKTVDYEQYFGGRVRTYYDVKWEKLGLYSKDGKLYLK